MDGWIKLHRQIISKAFYAKDSARVHLWIHILLKANHETHEEYLGAKPIICQPGQFTTGRKQLSHETGISESKIERILTYFEKIEQQIEQQKTSVNRLITIRNWHFYQDYEQPFEQRPDSDRTTIEQTSDNDRTHYKNIKKLKKLKNIRSIYVNAENEKSEFLTDSEHPAYEKKEKIDFEEIIAAFHSLCPALPKVQIIHQNRRTAITARLAEVGEQTLLKVFEMAGQSEFLNGKNESRWTASLDWLLKPANFTKTLEGTYNKSTNHGTFKPNDPRASAATGWDEPL
ncbi:MAG: hypothetical protein ACOYN5_15240 [Bacteroidales bacterium]